MTGHHAARHLTLTKLIHGFNMYVCMLCIMQDVKEVPQLFLQAWNASCSEPTVINFDWSQWRWLVSHLIVACRQSVAESIRCQFDSQDDEQLRTYVGDKEDGRHAYHCVGAVGRSLVTKFNKIDRIIVPIKSMFLDKTIAAKSGLPTHEVDNRFVAYPHINCCSIVAHTLDHRIFKCLLYANRRFFLHFKMVRERYHCVTHTQSGKVRVRDRQVLRRVTNQLYNDKQLQNKFVSCSDKQFHPSDVEKVFIAYLRRVETMMGNELAWQLMDELRSKKMDGLDALRKQKNKTSAAVRGTIKHEGSQVGVVNEGSPEKSGEVTTVRKHEGSQVRVVNEGSPEKSGEVTTVRKSGRKRRKRKRLNW